MTTHIAYCPNCRRKHVATNPPVPPTEKMIRCHAWIAEFMKSHDWPPTNSDIARAFDVSITTAWAWCNRLDDCGLLVRTVGGHKRIVKVLPIPQVD